MDRFFHQSFQYTDTVENNQFYKQTTYRWFLVSRTLAEAGFMFCRFSPIDLAAAGARRKNATRETTSTLKAWLYEHRKNPYPTKGEKIMLAIITKMTLTQVSTWFANARRRLKKENKMTWSPRNRCGEKKDEMDDDEGASDSDEDQSCDDDKLCDSKGENQTVIKGIVR